MLRAFALTAGYLEHLVETIASAVTALVNWDC